MSNNNNLPRTIVPAEPGWTSGCVCEDEDGRPTGFDWSMRIIAWIVEEVKEPWDAKPYTQVTAISAAGTERDALLRQPDGQILTERCLMTEQAALAYYVQQYEDKKKLWSNAALVYDKTGFTGFTTIEALHASLLDHGKRNGKDHGTVTIEALIDFFRHKGLRWDEDKRGFHGVSIKQQVETMSAT